MSNNTQQVNSLDTNVKQVRIAFEEWLSATGGKKALLAFAAIEGAEGLIELSKKYGVESLTAQALTDEAKQLSNAKTWLQEQKAAPN